MATAPGRAVPQATGRLPSEDKPPVLGLVGYTTLNLIGVVSWSFLTVLLWSSLLWEPGNGGLAFLQDKLWLSHSLLGGSVFLLLILYLLDFFLPPQRSGQYPGPRDKPSLLGRAVFALALLMFLAGAVFRAIYYPSAPMLVFVFIVPGVPLAVRLLTRPARTMRLDHVTIVGTSTEQRILLLRALVGQAEDKLNFYKAAMIAFFMSSAGFGVLWVLMLANGMVCFQDCSSNSDMAMEQYFCEAICPVVVSFSEFVFGMFALMRVMMHHTYLGTDRNRNLLASELGPEALDNRKMDPNAPPMVMAESSPADVSTTNGTISATTGALADECSRQEQSAMRQLTMMVKAVILTFVALIGLSYTTALLLYSDSKIVSAFTALLTGLFLIFLGTVAVGAARVARALGKWLLTLPVLKQIMGALKSDWVRALLLCLLLPPLVGCVVLSVLNQAVRRCRGTAGAPGDSAAGAEGAAGSTRGNGNGQHEEHEDHVRRTGLDLLEPDHGKSNLLTARAASALEMAQEFNWLSLWDKAYAWCILPMAYCVGSLLFNAAFSLILHLLSEVQFVLICVLTFFIGVVAFMWPTIPGMVVYMFGGLLLPGTCPWPAGDPGMQFWVGAGINIALGWFLKLSACAVQQKGIGERLGRSVKVRQMCRIHTPLMRTIDSVLRKPGLSVGKVAILCGAPDWPVSVMCGILGLSLLQCEIGTLPIIFYIIPCAMTGSLYLKADEGSGWEQAAGAMVFATTVVTGLLYVVMWWACQREYERNSEELARPKPEHADLFWLDHKALEVERRCATRWADLPLYLRRAFAAGAVAQILLGQLVVLSYSTLFGDFSVSEAWSNIIWYASYVDEESCHKTDGSLVDRGYCMFSTAGLAVIGMYLLSWIPYWALHRYLKQKTAKVIADVDEEYDKEKERQWIAAWTKQSKEAASSPPDLGSAGPPATTAASDVRTEHHLPWERPAQEEMPVTRPAHPERRELQPWPLDVMFPPEAMGESPHSGDVAVHEQVSHESRLRASDWQMAFCFLCDSWSVLTRSHPTRSVATCSSPEPRGTGPAAEA